MSDTSAPRDTLDEEQVRTAIEEMRANVEAMRASREQWQAEHELRERHARREDRRLFLYGVLVAAALLAAGGTFGAFVTQALR
mgnify:FL=1